ncbi:hypothetical protein [Salirhabdus salicampi]|uniref:hypothetical protein n=1 Tax=Salirhabdus salicampi TaxID=476102 RepID=UPI0020C4553D|nr:hypothetical protein [Salirhabdus salicampi]MCP8615810.1 hypothetical protein [Salirhabdus salicampi]
MFILNALLLYGFGIIGYGIIIFALVRYVKYRNTKGTPVFPVNEKELNAYRHPSGKNLDPFGYRRANKSFLIFFFISVFMMTGFLYVAFVSEDTGFLVFIVALAFQFQYLLEDLESFVLFDDRILINGDDLKWKEIISFEINKIDMAHKYYGMSEEMNGKDELVIRTKKKWKKKQRIIIVDHKITDKIQALFIEKGIYPHNDTTVNKR